MNAERRKTLAKALELLEEAQGMIDEARDDEQTAYDNLPESLQEGDRGQKMDEYISGMEYASTTLDDVIFSLGEVIDA